MQARFKGVAFNEGWTFDLLESFRVHWGLISKFLVHKHKQGCQDAKE